MTNSKKNKKILKGLFVIGLMLFSIVPISAVGETNLNDSNLTDKLINNLSNGINSIYDYLPFNNKSKRSISLHSGDSIQSAIDNANSGDVIELDGGKYAGGIDVNKSNITIRAANNNLPIIERNDNNSIRESGFRISNVENITIEGLLIKDFENNYGGGICISCSSVNVINCTITGNKANNGGGIWVNDDGNNRVNIIGCDIYNNTAMGGMIQGGGIYTYGNTTIVNSSIHNNTARCGGGIFAYQTAILNSNITNNNAITGDGISGSSGGIEVGYNTTVTGCNIVNNTADGCAGGIGVEFINCDVKYNRIFSNNAPESKDARTCTDLSFNWWGDNNDPYISGKVSKEISSWMVLKFTANPNLISPNQPSKLLASLTYDNMGNYHDPKDVHIPDGLTVEFPNEKSELFNGSAQSIFNSSTPDLFNISCKVDNQIVSTSVKYSIKDVYVSKDGNDSNLGNSPNCPMQNINHALNSVSDNGTVVLMSDFNVTDTIFVNKSVTIKKWDDKSDKVFLDAMYKTRIMFINTGLNVCLDGLSFNRGNDSDGGGLLTVDSATHINNCNFSNNMALNKGGALLALESPVNSSESKKSSLLSFGGNSSRNSFSRILSRDSLGISQNFAESVSPVLDIKNSSFIGNWANQTSSAVFSTVQHVNLSSTNFTANLFTPFINVFYFNGHDLDVSDDVRFSPYYFANGSNIVGIYGCFEKMNALSNLSNLSMICYYQPNSTDIANYVRNNHSFTAYFPNKNVSVSLSTDMRNFTEGNGLLFTTNLDDILAYNENLNISTEYPGYHINGTKKIYTISEYVLTGIAIVLGIASAISAYLAAPAAVLPVPLLAPGGVPAPAPPAPPAGPGNAYKFGLATAVTGSISLILTIVDKEFEIIKDDVIINRVSTNDDDAYVGDNVTIDLSVTGPTREKTPISDGDYDISINNKNIDNVPFKDGKAKINHTVGIDPMYNMPERAVYAEFFQQQYKEPTYFKEYWYSYASDSHAVGWKRDTPVLWINMTPAVDPKVGDMVNITLNVSLLSNRTLSGKYMIELIENRNSTNYEVNFINGTGKIENYKILNSQKTDFIQCRFIQVDKYNEVLSNQLPFNSINETDLNSIFSLDNLFKRGDYSGLHSRCSFNSVKISNSN
ncbi:MAG: right-handed parallel beta-helix repeat-containing protein [Methanobrevibacter sp.]|nr:right-handed parallel beta-helix repeat-containing protein [Candidatus Methanovirga australis]